MTLYELPDDLRRKHVERWKGRELAHGGYTMKQCVVCHRAFIIAVSVVQVFNTCGRAACIDKEEEAGSDIP